MRRCHPLSLLAAAAILCAGCAANQPARIDEGQEVVVPPATFTDTRIENYDLFPTYLMKPGDILDVLFQIRTWEEKTSFGIAVDHTVDIRFVHAPELNMAQKVLPDGTISLPYIGPVKVSGMSVAQLTEELKRRYAPVFKNPQLFVTVPETQESIKQLKADLHTSPRGLSRLVTIRPDGYVTFPMVGELHVAGRSIPEVGEELSKLYEKILPGLHCDLFLEKHSGSMIYVTGQVRSPGTFSVSKPVSALEAIAMAGGTLNDALLDHTLVVRRQGQKIVATRIDLKKTLELQAGGSVFFLFPDDVVIVPRTRLSQTAEVMRSLGDILFFRGWSLGFSWELHDDASDDGTTTTIGIGNQ